MIGLVEGGIMSFLELSELLGNWGEFIGSVAVVATLIYLAIQVRQNSQQMRDNVNSLQVSAYQELMSRVAEINRLGLENSELLDLNTKAIERPQELDDRELRRFMTHTISLIRHADMAFMQYERGLLDFERYRSSLGPFMGMMRSSALARAQVRMAAEAEGSPFTASFKRELVTLLADIPLDSTPPAEQRQRLMEYLAKEPGAG